MAKQLYQLDQAEAPASAWQVPVQPADGSQPLRRVPVAELPIPAATDSAAGLMPAAAMVKVSRILIGEGAPEGEVTAPPATLYFRTDGSGAEALYLKATGSESTGWLTLTAAASAAATAAAEAASLAADDVADKLAEVEGFAEAASTAAGDAADVLAELESLSAEVTSYDLTVDHGDADLTIADEDVPDLINRHHIWTIDGAEDVQILIEADAYKDAEHPERVVGIPIVRRGNGAGSLVVEYAGGSGLPTVIEPCGDPAIYVARDGDDTANTSGPLFAGVLPDQTVTAAAGDDRIIVTFCGISVKTYQATRTTALEVDDAAVEGARLLPFTQEAATGNGILAGGVAPIGSDDEASQHVVGWETNQAARESQFIISRAYKRIDQANPVAYSNRDPSPLSGPPDDGTYYSHGVSLDPGEDEGLYAVSCVTSSSSATLSNYSLEGGTAAVALANTNGAGTGSARDLVYAMLESANVDEAIVQRIRRLIASGNFTGDCAGFLLRPASTGAGPLGTVLTDDNGPAVLTRPNQRAVLLLYADGVTAELAGA